MSEQSSAAAKPLKRVLVVVNKWWECDPVMNVLLHTKASPDAVPWPEAGTLNHPRRQPRRKDAAPAYNPSPLPRAVFKMQSSRVEVWCISDLLEHHHGNSALQSSSAEKVKELPAIFGGAPADFVLAVGTAATFGEDSFNGCVAVGTRVFMHDAYPGGANSASVWSDKRIGELLESALKIGEFGDLTRILETAEPRLVPVPLNPARHATVLSAYNGTAVGTVNVTNYDDYVWADPETVAAFQQKNTRGALGSVETTHGLIRLAAEDALRSRPRFAFVSGICDRVGCFNTEVNPREYGQNFAASHNMGVVVGWMLPRIDELMAKV